MADFNPRSREGSDFRSIYDDSLQTISIHAPVKGATQQARQTQILIGISIHAPVKGATGHQYHMFPPIKYFNPRSREGSDVQMLRRHGCTQYFNPRSREGSDEITVAQKRALENFNPRSREGSDQTPNRLSVSSSNFNPRSREGSDTIMPYAVGPNSISIHAPVKGATPYSLVSGG